MVKFVKKWIERKRPITMERHYRMVRRTHESAYQSGALDALNRRLGSTQRSPDFAAIAEGEKAAAKEYMGSLEGSS